MVKKYVDQIEAELKQIRAEASASKAPQDSEEATKRLQQVLRRQAGVIATELGLSGDEFLVFMASTAVLTTAWLSYSLRREISELSKSPEERIALTEMLDSLGLALERTIESGISCADQAVQ